MGQPAARAGDSTTHGGVITAGMPTVFIGKMPAARVGDMHVCPLVTPGTPPVPHVGGPIAKGSTGVNIGGKPAARMGDMASCSGPPDSIVSGCTTVFIGETKAGGGGGGGAGTGEPTQAQVAAAISVAVAGVTTENEEENEHFIDVKFKDSANIPVRGGMYTIQYPNEHTTGGMRPTHLKRHSVPEGQYEITLQAITGVRWSVQEARDEDTVQCIVDTFGFDDDTPAIITIWVKNLNCPDKVVQTIENLSIQSGTLKQDWQPSFFSNSDEALEGSGFCAPSFFFTVSIAGHDERSGLLAFKDFIEIELFDEDDSPVADAKYQITLSSGEIRTGTLDANGYARLDAIPPGKCIVEFPELDDE